jgi:hypothetical protein
MGLDKILENHICLCGEGLPGGVVDLAADDSTQMTENRAASLARLHFDRIRQVHGTLGVMGDGYGLPVFGIVGNYAGAGPVEVPAVCDGDDGIGAGDDAAQAEASVLITLVTAEEVMVRFGIVGH